MYRRMMTMGALLILASPLVGTGCASTYEGTGLRTSPTRISAEELAEMRGQLGNLYEAVNRLRPRWLHGDVVVYQDQMFVGWENSLQEFGLDAAYYLSYLDRAQAVAQLPGLGSRHIDGAIILHTR